MFFKYLCYLLAITSPTEKKLPRLTTVSLWFSATTLNTEVWSALILQVCDWLCIVIDAHFQQLVLSQDARRPIIELQQVVEKRVSVWGFHADNTKSCATKPNFSGGNECWRDEYFRGTALSAEKQNQFGSEENYWKILYSKDYDLIVKLCNYRVSLMHTSYLLSLRYVSARNCILWQNTFHDTSVHLDVIKQRNTTSQLILVLSRTDQAT